MSHSQEKLKKVEDEISEYSKCTILSTHTQTLYTYSRAHIHTPYTNNILTEEKYGREVVVIPVDFSDGMEIYPNIAEQLNDLDIGVLGMQLVEKVHHSAIILNSPLS